MTKGLFAIVMTAAALTGCTHLPGTPMAEPVLESKVFRAVKPHVVPAKAEGEVASKDPNYVSHEISNWTTPFVQPAASKAAAAKPATVEITQVPTRAFRAYPVTNMQNQVVDARFSPSVPTASWEVAVEGSPMVSKVKVTLQGADGGAVMEEMLAPEDLAWPTDLTGSQSLSLPLNNRTVMTYLSKAPDATKLNVVAEPLDATGKPLKGRNGVAFKLQLPVEVI